MNDPRKDVYQDLHSGQMKAEEQAYRVSADRILTIFGEYLQPKSVLDVGCGPGAWLSVLQGRGVNTGNRKGSTRTRCGAVLRSTWRSASAS